MPHYEIVHTYDLTASQRQQLAEGITSLHCSTFSAPSIFVKVTFHHYTSTQPGPNYSRTSFVGGKETLTNSITGHLRSRTSPTIHTTLNTLTERITSLWNTLTTPTLPGSLEDPRALHSVLLMGDIAAGAELGFVVPVAGQDEKWAEENREKFRERAGKGDGSMKGLLEEMDRGFGKA